MNHLTALATAKVAASPPAAAVLAAAPTINTTGVVAWGVKFILPLILFFAGITIAAKFAANKGQMREGMTMTAGILLGVCLIVLGPLVFAFGQSFMGLFLGG